MRMFDKIYEFITEPVRDFVFEFFYDIGAIVLIATFPLWVLPYLLIKRRKKKEAER